MEIDFLTTGTRTWRRSMSALMTCLIVCIAMTDVLAQYDSLKEEIFRYTRSTEQLTDHARQFLRDKIAQHDRIKVGDVVDLMDAEIDEPFVLDHEEKVRLLFWLRRFDDIHKLYSRPGATYRKDYRDGVYTTIDHAVRDEYESIRADLIATTLPAEQSAFLQILLDHIIDRPWDDMKQSAKLFKRTYPQSVYGNFVHDDLSMRYIPFSASIFAGYSRLDGRISEMFTNPFSIGVSLECPFKLLVIGAYASVATGVETNDSIAFEPATWSKGADVDFTHLGLIVGFKLMESKRSTLYPFAGHTSISCEPTSDDEKDTPAYKSIGFKQKPAYQVGLNLDVRRRREAIADIGRDERSKYVRIRYAYTSTYSSADRFSGDMHSLSVGVGFSFRDRLHHGL